LTHKNTLQKRESPDGVNQTPANKAKNNQEQQQRKCHGFANFTG
jgi:hypothetical protein